ncbi:hypothetical protein LEP1GSC024_4322 [Leptospira noguchii str. 2001034031]|uniref:Uncharacterized protein n=1 Tax=Leptospira noguchii str. 2001034031 TaxID=1193053 RepID=M6YBE2_9LEPT|nr:hypothetical protein LEP1GSC024_4322 [Leptospira noguchii str. 2001034031]
MDFYFRNKLFTFYFCQWIWVVFHYNSIRTHSINGSKSLLSHSHSHSLKINLSVSKTIFYPSKSQNGGFM